MVLRVNQAVEDSLWLEGTGILSRTLMMGELGKGRADGKYLLHLMPSVPEAETEDGGGEGHLPKDLPQESRVL